MNHKQTDTITRTISSQTKLETLLYDLMKIAVAQGLSFEPGLIKARRRLVRDMKVEEAAAEED